MRIVPIKTREQQSVLMVFRTRQLFVCQRTTLINAIRAHMAEFGVVAGAGRPVDMMDKSDGLPTSPPAQQQQQGVIDRILAA